MNALNAQKLELFEPVESPEGGSNGSIPLAPVIKKTVSIPPHMLQTPSNPGGLPKSVFDGLQEKLAANRSTFYRDLASAVRFGLGEGIQKEEKDFAAEVAAVARS